MCKPGACAVVALALWKIHNGHKSTVESCPETDGSCKGCMACLNLFHTLYMEMLSLAFELGPRAFHGCDSADSV